MEDGISQCIYYLTKGFNPKHIKDYHKLPPENPPLKKKLGKKDMQFYLCYISTSVFFKALEEDFQISVRLAYCQVDKITATVSNISAEFLSVQIMMVLNNF